VTLNRIFLQWSDKLRYLGVHILYDLLGLKSLSISLNARSIVLRIVFLATLGVLPRKKLLYKLLFNSRFKCVPVLLYGLEACSLSKSDRSSTDFACNRFFIKLFKTDHIKIVKNTQLCFVYFHLELSWEIGLLSSN